MTDEHIIPTHEFTVENVKGILERVYEAYNDFRWENRFQPEYLILGADEYLALSYGLPHPEMDSMVRLNTLRGLKVIVMGKSNCIVLAKPDEQFRIEINSAAD